MNTQQIETMLVSDLTDTDRQALDDLRTAVYPPEVSANFHKPPSQPAPEIDWPAAQRERIFFIRDGSRILATSRFLPRRIETQQGPMNVHALAGVMTHPDARIRGLGRTVVQASLAYVDNGTFSLSLFQTNVPDFYRKLGCREVHNPTVNRLAEDPAARPWWAEFVMIYPANADWPAGPIDLCGPAW